MQRAVVHMGFHKTGTKSVQKFLAENKDNLSNDASIFLKEDIKEATHLARRFSQIGRPNLLNRFKASLSDSLATAKTGTDIVISSEDLSGLLPGRRNINAYDAAPQLARAIEDTLSELGEKRKNVFQTTFLFSTRDPRTWTESVWWQHLRSTRLSLDLKEYKEKSKRSSDLDGVVKLVEAELKHAKVKTEKLETSAAMQFGPASPIIDLIDLRPHTLNSLIPTTQENTRPAVSVEKLLLEVNRSALKDSDAKDIKRRIISAAKLS